MPGLRTSLLSLAALAITALAACSSTRAEDGDDSDEGSTAEAAISRNDYANCKKYAKLSETGLYKLDASGQMTSELADGVRPFQPAYEFFSDGAVKKRWISIPSGKVIDTSDMDHWRLPKGTKLWKEFAYNGKRAETRLIEIGCDADPAHPERGSGSYFIGAFAWQPAAANGGAPADAKLALQGGEPGIPTQDACPRCHNSEPGGILGFSAIQLSEADLPITLESLKRDRLLSHPPTTGTSAFKVPGDAKTKAALGYLHANCGHCHTEGGRAFVAVDQQLRLSVADTQVSDASETQVYKTIVNKKAQSFIDEDWTRIASGLPDKSFIFYRMSSTERRMPPGRRELDVQGTATIKTWIESLPR